MKKGIAIICLAALFVSCGEEAENENTTEVNGSGESSVIGNANPENGVAVNTNTDNSTSEDVSGEETTIEYFETKHNFGNVFYPSDNKYTFKFKNTGDQPLIIEKATASCGCTVPNKPEEPIMPGEIGEMDVIFRPKSGQVGQTVTKKVTVTANTNPKETYLDISAKVLEAM